MTREDIGIFLQIIRQEERIFGILHPMQHIVFLLIENPGCKIIFESGEWSLVLGTSSEGKQVFKKEKS